MRANVWLLVLVFTAGGCSRSSPRATEPPPNTQPRATAPGSQPASQQSPCASLRSVTLYRDGSHFSAKVVATFQVKRPMPLVSSYFKIVAPDGRAWEGDNIKRAGTMTPVQFVVTRQAKPIMLWEARVAQPGDRVLVNMAFPLPEHYDLRQLLTLHYTAPGCEWSQQVALGESVLHYTVANFQDEFNRVRYFPNKTMVQVMREWRALDKKIAEEGKPNWRWLHSVEPLAPSPPAPTEAGGTPPGAPVAAPKASSTSSAE